MGHLAILQRRIIFTAFGIAGVLFSFYMGLCKYWYFSRCLALILQLYHAPACLLLVGLCFPCIDVVGTDNNAHLKHMTFYGGTPKKYWHILATSTKTPSTSYSHCKLVTTPKMIL